MQQQATGRQSIIMGKTQHLVFITCIFFGMGGWVFSPECPEFQDWSITSVLASNIIPVILTVTMVTRLSCDIQYDMVMSVLGRYSVYRVTAILLVGTSFQNWEDFTTQPGLIHSSGKTVALLKNRFLSIVRETGRFYFKTLST